MPSEKSAPASSGTSGEGSLLKIKEELQVERVRLHEQIGSYPQPIPACDAQFNYLLETRSRLSDTLKLIDELLAEARSERTDPAIIERLVTRLKQVDAQAADKLVRAFQLGS